MRLKDIVSKDPDVHSGDLVFAGTRVPAIRLVSYPQKGHSLDRFIKGFPRGIAAKQRPSWNWGWT